MFINPLVSIIMPSYNYGRYISEALDSLLAQTYFNWECIIVDDGSSDNTREVVKDYVEKDERFIYIYQQNKGVSAARNEALRKAKGAFFQLLDADDMLKPEKLALHVSLFQLNKNIDLVYSNALLFDDDGNKERSFRLFQLPDTIPVSGKYEILIDQLLFDNIFLTPSVIFRRRIYEQVGYFIEGLHGLEDWNYWYRAALLGFEFYHDTTAEAQGIIRAHNTSTTRKQDKMLFGRIVAREQVISFIKELKEQGKLNLCDSYVNRVINLHMALLNKDKVKYYIFFEDKIFIGLKSILLNAYFSNKPLTALYDGGYWIKERLKKRFNK